MLKRSCLLGCWLVCWMAGLVRAELHLITEESPPTSFSHKGELHGYAVDVVRALIERTGDAARIELMPWTRGYSLAQQRPDTAVFSTVRTPEREARFQWVGPLLIGTTRFYSLKSRNLRFDTLQDAAASGPLAAVRQWYTYETLEVQGFKNLYGVASSKNMVTMLKHGRVKLIVAEDLTLDAELATGGLRVVDVQAHLPLMRSAYYIAFSPQTDVAVIERWQEALRGMHQDGSFAEVFQRWMPHAELPAPPP